MKYALTDIALKATCVVCGVWLGVVSFKTQLLNECRAAHNVYECEIVAVPKEGKQNG